MPTRRRTVHNRPELPRHNCGNSPVGSTPTFLLTNPVGRLRVIALENGYEYELLAGYPLGHSGFVTKLHGSDATLTLEDHVDLLKD